MNQARRTLTGTHPALASTLIAMSIGGTAACTVPESEVREFEPFAEAVLRWEQPDSTPLRTYSPIDMKAETPDAGWITDQGTGAVFRFDPSRSQYLQMGILDEPPEEVVLPAKVVISRSFGVFTFDMDSGLVHQFSVEGEPLRAFDPGFVPSRMELVESPIALVFGVIDDRDPRFPRLFVVRTDLLGVRRDTLLHPDTHGPASLWSAIASSGELSLDGGESGLWAWAQAVPDTVFEVTDAAGARKRVLRPEDRDASGILVDLQRDILWVVRQSANEGEFVYAAYDAGTAGTLDAAQGFLGERTTGGGFVPWDAIEGTIMGFTRPTATRFNLASYDMRVPPTR